MISNHELITYLNQLLMPNSFADYCPNGLQVEGKTKIETLVTGVTASQLLLDKAVAERADAILVHHGYFWRDEAPVITGIRRERIATLLNNQINLLAYHLPLDTHPEYGNNTQLAQRLDLKLVERVEVDGQPGLLNIGYLQQAMAADKFAEHIEYNLQRKPLHIAGHAKMIKTVAWCTGAAHRYISNAQDYGVDAYLSGEISESTVHIARESGLHYYAAGHHATERYGVQALGAHLADKYQLKHIFIDIDNPV